MENSFESNKESRVLFISRGRPGLGHVSPCVKLYKELRRKYQIDFQFISYQLGADMLHKLRLPIYDLDYSPQGLYPGIEPIPHLFPKLLQFVREWRPNLIITSGEFYVPLLCAVEKIPCCVLLNGAILNVETDFFAGVRPFLIYLLSMTDMIVDYSFTPRTNLPDELIYQTISSGPLVRNFDTTLSQQEIKGELGIDKDKFLVLVTKGGGELLPEEAIGGKGSSSTYYSASMRILEKSIEAYDLLSVSNDIAMVLITGLGMPVEDRKQLRQRLSKDVFLIEFTDEMQKYLYAADVVICRGGLNLTGEALIENKPLILTPPDIDHEATQNSYNVVDFYENAVVIPTNELTDTNLAAAITKFLNKSAISETSIYIESPVTMVAEALVNKFL